jgi:hypothetical protein
VNETQDAPDTKINAAVISVSKTQTSIALHDLLVGYAQGSGGYGEYYFTVYAVSGNPIKYNNSASCSSTTVDVEPLVIDGDSVKWSTATTGTATWSASTGSGNIVAPDHYAIALYRGGAPVSLGAEDTSTAGTSVNLSSYMAGDGSYYFTVQAVGDGITYQNSAVYRSDNLAVGGVYTADGFATDDFPDDAGAAITVNGAASTHKGTAADPHLLHYAKGDSLTIALAGSPNPVYWSVDSTDIPEAENQTSWTFQAGSRHGNGTYTITVRATIDGVEYSATTVVEVDL